MKHLKLFEDMWHFGSDKLQRLTGYYIESQLPKEYYFGWEFDLTDNNKYFFYYDFNVSKDVLAEINSFLNEHDIEYEIGVGIHGNSKYKKRTEIMFILSNNKVKEFANFKKEIDKYNL